MSEPVTETVKLREHVSEEVRALLGRRRMTNVQLAEHLGKSRTYVGRRLGGEVAWDLDDLENIARVLRVRVSDLLPDRPAGNSPWYDRHVQTAIARKADPSTSRPRDSRPANRPSGPPRPVTLPGTRRPQPRFATLSDAGRVTSAGRLPA